MVEDADAETQQVDLGRMLGMLIRGPLVDLLRGQLVNARAGELKQAIEAG